MRLAQEAGVSPPTVQRAEDPSKLLALRANNLAAMKRALELGGVVFRRSLRTARSALVISAAILRKQ
jgi:hypothetical protein